MEEKKISETIIVSEQPATPLAREHSETTSLSDKDEAFVFLETNPRAAELTERAQALLEDPVQYRALLRKVDFCIMPLVGTCFFLSHLDKLALEFTAVMGIREDTHLVGQQYSLVGMVFYIGLLAVELPTQLLAQRIGRPGLYLGINTILWGIAAASHAACTSFAGLVVSRILLGMFESCMYPLLVLIIAMWYKKHEQGRRVSWLTCMSMVCLVVGALTAYGMSYLKTAFAAWRIFYLSIGTLTIAFGVVLCMLLPDSPVQARRFSEVEKVAALLRTRDNQTGTQNSKIKREQIFETFRDGRVWMVSAITLLSAVPAGGLATFGTILVTTFGFTKHQALLLAVPRGFIGITLMLTLGYLSDRFNDRSTIVIVGLLPAIMAVSLMIGFDPQGIPLNKHALLAGSLLSVSAAVMILLIMAWNSSNIAGHTKKVTMNAITLVFYAAGNILGTQIFRDTEYPSYISAKSTIIACWCALFMCTITLRLWNNRLNKKNESILAAMTEEEREGLRSKLTYADVTDRVNPFFVYTH